MELFDCDENSDGPARFNTAKNPALSWGYTPIRTDEDLKPIAVEKCFDNLLKQLEASKTNGQKVAVVDSLTHVNEFILRKILHDQGNKVIMEPHYWTVFKSLTYNLLVAKLRGLGKTTICCCHEVLLVEADQKQIGKETVIGYKPAYQGGVVDYFGGFFTDMWRVTSRGAPAGKTEYVLTCGRTQKSDYLKNSLGLPSEIVIPEGQVMFDKIAPYLKGRL